MVVLDHYESDMFKMSNNHLVDNFKNSDMGKTLLRQLIGHPKTGIDTRNVDTNLRFFYSQVPRQNKYTKAYLKPRVAELNKSFETMMALIRQYQPDIMVCYGSWFKQRLVKEYKLKKDQAEPVHLVTDDIDTYVSFCPSPHKLKLMGSNERDQILIQNRMINRFLKGNGIESLKPEMGNYELITDFNKAKEILTKTVYSYPIVAVDFETNTLETYLPGAKAIMISLSWKEHQGISIPIDHRLAPDLWTDEQKQAIIGWIKDLMRSKQLKVLHNCIYDIHMLMDIYDLDKATNCVDTLMMYYETVDESQGALRGLKHLAYIYTNMGGYEDTRDQAFEQYLQDHYDHWLRVEMEKYKNGERKDKPSHRNYTAPTNPVDGAKQDFEWLPMEVLYTYAAADTDVTLQLYNIFAKNVHKRPKWHKLIYDFYPKLCDVLAYLQHNGFQIDQDKLAQYDEHFTKDITELTEKMNKSIPEIQEYNEHRLAQLRKREAIKKIKPADRTPEEKQYFKDYAKLNGNDPNSGLPKYKFNPSSGEKIAYVLYEMMGYQLPAEKEYLKPKAVEQRKLSKPETITWKDYKVDKNAALPYLVKEYDEPLAKMLLQYSNDKKMITGVINGYGKLLDPKGRVHSTFKPYGTATSRLASTNPNAQNYRKPTSNVNDPNYHYSVKGLFRSRFKDGYLVNIDYKSLEVFIASLVSKDVGMMQALMDGADIHKRNASIAFDIPIDEVDAKHRQLAKAVTFGVLYGEGAQGLSESRGLSLDEAEETIKKVMRAMPQVERTNDLVQTFAEKTGFVETISGHMRRLPGAMANDKRVKSRAIRQSYNSLVQGSGAYCTNTALIYIREALSKFKLKSKIVITVHDSIVLDVPKDEILIVPLLAKRIMETLPIPEFIMEAKDFPTLKIDPKYMVNDHQFRFPLFAEMEFGKTYADGLDFELDDIKKLGIDTYYQYASECKYVKDKYNTALSQEEDNDKKSKIVETMDQELDKIHDKYFK